MKRFLARRLFRVFWMYGALTNLGNAYLGWDNQGNIDGESTKENTAARRINK